jgi:hypothetical protein
MIRSKSYERESSNFAYFTLYGGFDEDMINNHLKNGNAHTLRALLKNEIYYSGSWNDNIPKNMEKHHSNKGYDHKYYLYYDEHRT